MKKFLIVLLALMLPLCVALAEDAEIWVDTSNAPELPAGRLRRPSSPLPPITPIPCMPRRTARAFAARRDGRV